MSEPFYYSIYGLVIRADGPLPGLRALTQAASFDVDVCLQSMPGWFGSDREEPEAYYPGPQTDQTEARFLTVWRLRRGEFFWFRYEDQTQYIVDRAGTSVWTTWPPAFTVEDAVSYLVGPVLGFVVRLRGGLGLHASVVALGDRAIAFMGPVGSGKSTTAAALASRGYAVLADDRAILAPSPGGFLVQPAYPLLRLWPESIGQLLGAGSSLPRLTPNWDKRALDLDGMGYRFQELPLPLAAVYVLEARGADAGLPRIEALAPADALVALVRNASVNYLLDRSMRAREFSELGRLVATVPIRRLVPHEDPSRIGLLCDVVLKDLQRLPPRERE